MESSKPLWRIAQALFPTIHCSSPGAATQQQTGTLACAPLQCIRDLTRPWGRGLLLLVMVVKPMFSHKDACVIVVCCFALCLHITLQHRLHFEHFWV